MSCSESEPDSASLHQWEWPICRTLMKPDIDDEAIGQAVVGLSGVVGGGACGQISRGTWETRAKASAGVGQPIVAGKRGNDRGAKGLNVNVQL
jgi:hypothetical protein